MGSWPHVSVIQLPISIASSWRARNCPCCPGRRPWRRTGRRFPGSRPRPAFGGVAQVGGQDAGGRAPRWRYAAHAADPFAGGGADRPGHRIGSRRRRGSRGVGRAHPRHRASAVRAQRRTGARRDRRRVRRFRGQCTDAADPRAAGAEDPRRHRQPVWPEPDARGPRRACKYPWTPIAPDGTKRTKYGAYQEDAPILDWIRAGAPYGRQCLEAQIMDWSDDVAYSVHDVEDGIVSGRIDLGVLWDTVELAALADKGALAFGGDPAELVEAAGRLAQLARGLRRGVLRRFAAVHGGAETDDVGAGWPFRHRVGRRYQERCAGRVGVVKRRRRDLRPEAAHRPGPGAL